MRCAHKLALAHVGVGCYWKFFWNALEIGELITLVQSSSRSLLHPPVALSVPELLTGRFPNLWRHQGSVFSVQSVKVRMEVDAPVLIEFLFAPKTGELGVFQVTQ